MESEHLNGLIASAPKPDGASVSRDGFYEALQVTGVDPGSALAATWCSFGQRNIEALVDATQLTVIHPLGVLSSAGKRGMMNKAVKFDSVAFSDVQGFGADEYTDPRA